MRSAHGFTHSGCDKEHKADAKRDTAGKHCVSDQSRELFMMCRAVSVRAQSITPSMYRQFLEALCV